MPIQVSCSNCQTSFRIPEQNAGKLIRCTKCQTVFRAGAPTLAVQPAADPDVDLEPVATIATDVQPRTRPTATEGGAPPRAKSSTSRLDLVLGGCGALLFLMLGCGGVVGYFAYTGSLNYVKNLLTNATDKKPDEAPTYTLKIKSQPSPGKATRITSTETIKGSIKVLRGGALQEQPINGTTEKIYTCVVLEGGEPRPRKFKEIYEKATDSGPLPRIFPYQGRTITYDLQGENYRVTPSPGPQLPVKDEKKLARNARVDFADAFVLPGKPVRVGDTWNPDLKLFGDQFSGDAEINVADSKIVAKLDKVYEKNGQQFAVLALEINLSVTKLEGFPPTIVGRVELKGTQEFVLDGSSTAGSASFTGKIQAHGPFEAGSMKGTIDMTGDLTLKEEHSAETGAPK